MYAEMIRLILSGVWLTVLIFAAVIVLALPLGFLVTLLLRSRVTPLRGLARAYVYVIRGTPLLLQLIFFFYGLYYIPVVGPWISMYLGREEAAILAFVINYSAYFAEIFRGGMNAVDRGQYEASQVLGLTRFQTTVHIAIPQMLRVVLPALTNESVTLVKDSALIYAVGLLDILGRTKDAVNLYASAVPYIFAGILYLALTSLVTLIYRRIETRFRSNVINK